MTTDAWAELARAAEILGCEPMEVAETIQREVIRKSHFCPSGLRWKPFDSLLCSACREGTPPSASPERLAEIGAQSQDSTGELARRAYVASLPSLSRAWGNPEDEIYNQEPPVPDDDCPARSSLDAVFSRAGRRLGG